MRKRLALSLVLVLGAASLAHATTYYVNKSGSNGNSCATAQSATPGNAKLTVVAGISCLSTSDTLIVSAGTYAEAITSAPSGTSGTYTTIRAATGETVTLKPTSNPTADTIIWLDCSCHYIEFDGINTDGTSVGANITSSMWTSTNNLLDPHHIRFKNATSTLPTVGAIGGSHFRLGAHTTIGATGGNEIINVTMIGGGDTSLCGFDCASYGVYIQGPNNLVEYCTIINPAGAGIQIYGDGGDGANGNIVRNNRIRDITRTGSLNEVWGILVSGASNQIYNNLIYNIAVGAVNVGNAGIAVDGSSNKIWNNTIYNNTNSGIYIGSGASSTEVRNNITYLNTGAAYTNAGSGTTHTNDLTTNPTFTSAATGDFTLAIGSTAIDQGVTVASVTNDFVGTARPQGAAYDIGAYEYVSAPTPPTPGTGPVRLRSVCADTAPLSATVPPGPTLLRACSTGVGVTAWAMLINGTRKTIAMATDGIADALSGFKEYVGVTTLSTKGVFTVQMIPIYGTAGDGPLSDPFVVTVAPIVVPPPVKTKPVKVRIG